MECRYFLNCRRSVRSEKNRIHMEKILIEFDFFDLFFRIEEEHLEEQYGERFVFAVLGAVRGLQETPVDAVKSTL